MKMIPDDLVSFMHHPPEVFLTQFLESKLFFFLHHCCAKRPRKAPLEEIKPRSSQQEAIKAAVEHFIEGEWFQGQERHWWLTVFTVLLPGQIFIVPGFLHNLSKQTPRQINPIWKTDLAFHIFNEKNGVCKRFNLYDGKFVCYAKNERTFVCYPLLDSSLKHPRVFEAEVSMAPPVPL